MNIYLANILNILDDQESELSQLKKILIQLRKKPEDKVIVAKYAIPAFYSIWEGFFVKSLEEYISYLNSLSLHSDQFCEEILSHNLDVNMNLKEERTDFNSIKKFQRKIKKYYDEDFFISNKILTESNVNFRIANKMLHRLSLLPLPGIRKSELDKLLLFRNNISHGESSVPCDDNIINELSVYVTNAMYDLVNIINNGIENETFKKAQ